MATSLYKNLRVTLAALLLLGTTLTTFDTRAEGPRHAVLYYLSSALITSSNTKPLVAYIAPNGKALDWMFDGMIIYDIRLVNRTLNGVVYPQSVDIDRYISLLFDNNGQLATLAGIVANLKTELNDPGYRLKVYLTVPYLKDTDVNAKTQLIIDRFNSANLSGNLELVGFYWGYEEHAASPGAPVYMKASADFLHSRGYEFIWIPYSGSVDLSGWKSFGFDRATLQPNYAFLNVPLSHFQTTDDRFRRENFTGLELEFGVPTNTLAPQTNAEEANAQAYLEAARQFNWVENSFNTYYHGLVISNYSTSMSRRKFYDQIYQYTATRPRHSVAARASAVASADAYVQNAVGYENVNRGNTGVTFVGTNGYPNALRSYYRFNIPTIPVGMRVIAAYMTINQQGFSYGSSLDDAALYSVDASAAWQESTLTSLNQPRADKLGFIGQRRFLAGTSRYIFDVTEQVKSSVALNQSSVSFMLKRITESGSVAQVALYAREAGAGLAPTLEVVYAPN